MEDGCFAQFAGGPENRRLTFSSSEAAERFSGFFLRLLEMRSGGSRPTLVSRFLLASISTWDIRTGYLASFFSAAFGGLAHVVTRTEACPNLLLVLRTTSTGTPHASPLHGGGRRSVGEKSR
jgi:hypothetical protein